MRLRHGGPRDEPGVTSLGEAPVLVYWNDMPISAKNLGQSAARVYSSSRLRTRRANSHAAPNTSGTAPTITHSFQACAGAAR